jgi:low affinity Fe/Cu permease
VSTWLRRLSDRAAHAAGTPRTLVVVLALSLAWGVATVTGRASDRAQLLVTLLLSVLAIVLSLLIQSSQNRDGASVHAKLDELLHAVEGARDEVAQIDDATEEEIQALRTEQRAGCAPTEEG